MRAVAAAAVAAAMLVGSLAVPAGAAPFRADRDGDKVFDNLEALLERTAAGSKVRVIVLLRKKASAQQLEALKKQVGAFSVSDRFSIVDAFSARMGEGQVRALARRGDVAHVERDSRVQALNDSAQGSFGVTQARVDAPQVEGNADGNVDSYSASDLVAAVIDTGIDAGHRDLDEGKVIAFKDFVNGRTVPYDDDGHGTHVAATIAGEGDAMADRRYRGVAPGAALVGVKVLDGGGSGFSSDVIAGIQWAVQNRAAHGIEAINLSLGGTGCSNGTDAESLSVNAAHDAGLVVAVAAGNSGPGTCTIASPGAAAKALTVGAMADMSLNGFFLASFSSRGKTLDGRIKPDISAPGVSITSAAGGTSAGYATYSGTSMATPFVTGVALLMRDANPGLTSQQVKDKIMQTAVDWGRGGDNLTAGSTGPDIDYGAGRLDAYAALASAGAGVNTPPPMPSHELWEGTLANRGGQLDYSLEVTDTAFPIAATLIHPSVTGPSAWTPNFNLYLLSPTGVQVASATSSLRQDQLSHKPTVPGTYTLRLTSQSFGFFASGSAPFFVDISAGLGVPTTPPSETTPPSITSVSPPDGATGVPTDTNPTVAFSEPMDQAATQAAFSLVRSSDSSPIAGTFSWSGNTMTFDPSNALAGGVSYTARVGTGAKDASGNSLPTERTWSFTTSNATAQTAFPSSTVIETGTLRAGDETRLSADDNSFYEVDAWGHPKASSWYGRFTGIGNALTNLKVGYKGKNSTSCSQTVDIWRWTTNTWVQLDARSVGTSEVALALAPPGAAPDYVSGTSGPGEVRVRIRCSTSGFWGFYSSGDLLKLDYVS